jgi:hypothetical protein
VPSFSSGRNPDSFKKPSGFSPKIFCHTKRTTARSASPTLEACTRDLALRRPRRKPSEFLFPGLDALGDELEDPFGLTQNDLPLDLQ